MRRTILKAIILIFSCLIFTGIGKAQSRSSVLLELFSSEGCESCPFADAFVKEILNLADSTQSPVYVLDFHVVLWNRSGWVDPFSDSSFSDRQHKYMKKVKQEAEFTPMMFVNGKYGLPAGDKKDIGIGIYNALAATNPISLSINAAMLSDGKGIVLNYEIETQLDSLIFSIALAEKVVTNQVTAGENKDKTLTHHNLVRKFYSFPLKEKKGSFTVPVDPAIELSNYVLVSFIQKASSWEVLTSDQLNFRR